jgi:hypothetical protein
LDRLRRALHLCLVQLDGGGHVEREQVSQRVDGDVDLGPFLRLAPSFLARYPLSSVLWSLRLSVTTAVGRWGSFAR